MYRVEVSDVPHGSEWDIRPSSFPTMEEATQFALGIGRTLIAMANSDPDDTHSLTVSIIGPEGVVLAWRRESLLAGGYLFPNQEEDDADRPQG
jgi:hypothetical protein